MYKKGGIAFAIATMIGMWIGWSSYKQEFRQSLSSKSTTSSLPAVRPKWRHEDFLDFVRQRSARFEKLDYNPLTGELANWTDREIIDALNASLSDPEIMLDPRYGANLATLLLAEWMRRDFSAALAWFDGLESKPVKARLLQHLEYHWPEDKVEEGLAFVRSHLPLFSWSSYDQLIVNAFGSRAKQGASAVEGLLKILKEENIRFEVSHPIQFPPDFDFPALVKTAEFKELWDRGGNIVSVGGGCTMFLRGWSERDRDAAFQWLLDNHGVEALTLNLLLQPRKWIGSKIASLDPAQRSEYVDQNHRGWLQFPGNLVQFTQEITDPAFLDQLRAIGVQSLHGGNAHNVMPLLEGIEDPAKRIELLENTPPPSKEDKPYLGGRFDHIDEGLLRAKLAEWNAPQERIDAIIARFKP